ncbi:alpha/beta fold hydrolase [Tepidicaulis sp. LMO-SS28]|uniref:alpha/beta fold hydrolase n=1 Tax=Tepidicaulis sp. LMO-SS28 TaxID=3447455 RepID=UPI003EE35A7A
MPVWVWVLCVLGAVLMAALFYSLWYERRVAKAFPPAGQFVEVAGARLHYVEAAPQGGGTGVPIVLIHGASGNLRDFLVSIFPALALKHRVIAFDRPGHGWSGRTALKNVHDPAVQARLIRDALLKLGVEKAVVLGHSWGGAVAAAYALHFPQNLEGVLVLSGATHPWEGGVAWYHGVAGVPLLGPAFVRLFAVLAGQFLTPAGVAGNFWPDAAPEGYAQSMGLALLFRLKTFLANSADTRNLKGHLKEQSKRYGEIDVPLLIMTGNRDRTVSAKIHSYVLHEAVPGSELIKLKGTGHMPHHARGDLVVEAVSRLATSGDVRPGLWEVEAE